MKLKNYVVLSFLAVNGNMESFKKQFPYALIPEILNKSYNELHFLTDDVSDTLSDFYYSTIRFEHIEISDLKESFVATSSPHAQNNVIRINDYLEINAELLPEYREAIKWHLLQDKMFEKFIEELILISNSPYIPKYSPKVQYLGDEDFSENQIIDLIPKMEDVILYNSIHMSYLLDGTLINQEWLNINVKPRLYEVFNKEIADVLWPELILDKDMDKLISDKNWSKDYDSGQIHYGLYQMLQSCFNNQESHLEYIDDWEFNDETFRHYLCCYWN